MKPTIYYQGNYTQDDIQKLIDQHDGVIVKDIRQQQLLELFEIENPESLLAESQQKRQQYLDQKQYQNNTQGDWIYLPWRNTIIHGVSRSEFDQIRLNRNQLLINSSEQAALRSTSIGFLGLSIGGHFVHSLARTGIGRSYRIADPDTISTSNLNRVTAGIADIGEPKTSVLARQIYEINPYQEIAMFDQGVYADDLASFIQQPDCLSLIFEAVDDFRLKIKTRVEARRQRIPVVMITNLGDSILVDVERYDLNPQLPLFNGLLGADIEKKLDQNTTNKDLVSLTLQVIPPADTPTRALETLMQFGKSVVGRPQIYSTVAAGGGVAGYIARRLIIGPELRSGRYRIDFPDVGRLNVFHDQQSHRSELLQELSKKVNGD